MNDQYEIILQLGIKSVTVGYGDDQFFDPSMFPEDLKEYVKLDFPFVSTYGKQQILDDGMVAYSGQWHGRFGSANKLKLQRKGCKDITYKLISTWNTLKGITDTPVKFIVEQVERRKAELAQIEFLASQTFENLEVCFDEVLRNRPLVQFLVLEPAHLSEEQLDFLKDNLTVGDKNLIGEGEKFWVIQLYGERIYQHNIRKLFKSANDLQVSFNDIVKEKV